MGVIVEKKLKAVEDSFKGYGSMEKYGGMEWLGSITIQLYGGSNCHPS